MTMSAPFSYPEYRSFVGDYYGGKSVNTFSMWQRSERPLWVDQVRDFHVRFSAR